MKGNVYRPNLGRKIPLAMAAVVAILTVIAAITEPGGSSFAYVWRVSLPVISLIVIAVLLLVSRPKLVIRPQGLQVVNILHAREVIWSEVVAVRFARDAPWASLDLADGSKLTMMAVQNSDGIRAREMATEIADLSSR